MTVRVLVVEDSEPDFCLAKSSLRQAFVEPVITRARTLEEAMVLAENIDLLLLDLGLPGVDGVAGVDLLVDRHPELPIVVLTGRAADDPIAIDAIRCGAQDYLSKGDDVEAVARGIRHSLERHRLVLELRKAKQQLEAQAKELSRLASHDSLTGLPNRRVVEMALQSMPARARRLGATAYGVLFDLDDFKAVNDVHGLHGGDEVLRKIASTVSALVRPGDVLARIGGDEFVLLFTSERRSGAIGVVERVRACIEDVRPAVPVRITASFALVSIRSGQTIAQFLRRARTALETSKKTGKNRFAIREATGDIEVAALGAQTALLDPRCYDSERWFVRELRTGSCIADWLRPRCEVGEEFLGTLELAALAAEGDFLDVVGEHCLSALIPSALRRPTWFSILPESVDSVSRFDGLDSALCAIHVQDSLLPIEATAFCKRLKRHAGARSVILSTSLVSSRFFESMVHLEPSFVVYQADPLIQEPHHRRQLTRLLGVCDALGIKVACQGLERYESIAEELGIQYVVQEA